MSDERCTTRQQNITDHLLASCVRAHVAGAGWVTLTPIPTGHFNSSYFAEAAGREYVLRVAPPAVEGLLFYERDMMRQEPALHALLLERTSIPVPRVVAFDASHEIVDRDFLLLERLPGRPLSEAPVARLDPILARTGECLAEAHAITAGSYGYLGEHHPMEPQPAWRDAFFVMWHKLLDDVRTTGHYSDDDDRFMRALLDRHAAVFERDVPASLLHMDVWGQNILVEGDRMTGLLDWDRALWGDPEIEFAVLDYCGISEPAFWEGYGRERNRSAEARIRQVFYLLYEIQKYVVIRHFRRRDPQSARAYKTHAFELARQLRP